MTLIFGQIKINKRKTQRAAQTVSPRDLKLCQWVDQKSRRAYQILSPIGP